MGRANDMSIDCMHFEFATHFLKIFVMGMVPCENLCTLKRHVSVEERRLNNRYSLERLVFSLQEMAHYKGKNISEKTRCKFLNWMERLPCTYFCRALRSAEFP
jgi:hypothetical protein